MPHRQSGNNPIRLKLLVRATIALAAGSLGCMSALAQVATEFTGTPPSGSVPLAVQFTDQSTGNPSGWAWYFGQERLDGAWERLTQHAGWSARDSHSTVVLPDGSVVLMGGHDAGLLNDVWRSTDGGSNWTEQTSGAAWAARMGHTSLALPDGGILVTGGRVFATLTNDVWRSDDQGVTWTQIVTNAPWAPRRYHATTLAPDGSILLMGGRLSDTTYITTNDVWRSTDQGASWTLITNNAPWTARESHAGLALSDSTIMVMGGWTIHDRTNDVWRSEDNGAHWTLVTGNAPWAPRFMHNGVKLPDDSIVIISGDCDGSATNDVWRSTDRGVTWIEENPATELWRHYHSVTVLHDGTLLVLGGFDTDGGWSRRGDVWQLATAGTNSQHPSHIYDSVGTYRVSLQSYNSAGVSSLSRADYITVTPPAPAIGILGMDNTPITNGAAADQSRGSDFGSNFWGTGSTNIFIIINSGTANLHITGITTNGAHAAFFQAGLSVGNLAPGATAQLTVAFLPPQPGAYAADLRLINNTGISPFILNLAGTGARRAQAIRFDPLPDKSVTDTATLSAASDSGLPVSFTITGPGTIADTTNLRFTAVGTITVQADQPGNQYWRPAPAVARAFEVTEHSLALAADIDGDGQADPIVYDTSTGTWRVRLSGEGYAFLEAPGLMGGLGWEPLTADFDGDGRADLAVYHAAGATWKFRLSSDEYSQEHRYDDLLGGHGWKPLGGDLDLDHRADPTVYAAANGQWRALLSGSLYASMQSTPANFLGGPEWSAVMGDVDGDGLADLAVYKSATGNWKICLSTSGYTAIHETGAGWLGGPGRQAVLADFDGDGKADPAVWDATQRIWRIRSSLRGYELITMPAGWL
ncbi:MAG: kelch repeat-containing protein [Kiritimatiellia bacterium]